MIKHRGTSQNYASTQIILEVSCTMICVFVTAEESVKNGTGKPYFFPAVLKTQNL